MAERHVTGAPDEISCRPCEQKSSVCRCCCHDRSSWTMRWSTVTPRGATLAVWLAVMLASARTVQSGLNCDKFNISCDHGTCVEALTQFLPNTTQSPASAVDANKTAKAICVCDDRWSGPNCDIFSCSGRMMSVLIQFAIIRMLFFGVFHEISY